MKLLYAGISLSSLSLAMLAAAPCAAQVQVADPAKAATASAQNDAKAAAVAALLSQARYWQARGQTAQARDSLRRLLALDPTNIDALVLRVKIDLAQGDAAAATGDLAALRRLQPAAPQLSELNRLLAEAANPVDTKALGAARKLAQAGNYAQAVGLYRKAFHGATPPPGYGVEYYQTLAGAPGGWGQAVAGLGNLVAQNPGDLQAQLAFASVQTYQPAQRQQGIGRLAKLTAFPAVAHDAAAAWKQALAYLPETPDSVPQYRAYLAKYPNDPTVLALLAAVKTVTAAPTDVEGNARAKGFAALNADQLAVAAAAFQAALAIDPSDADALGGMGLVRLREGQNAAARDLLQQAIAANPPEAPHWEAALAGADRGARYGRARALARAGNIGGAEQELKSIIAGGGNLAGAYEMLANLQAQQGDLSGAAASWREVLARQPKNSRALVGLGGILSQQGDFQDAETLFQQAEANGQGALAARAQAQSLRAQAKAARDPALALALYRAAVTAAPDDPWARLDYARALKRAGQAGMARAQMDRLVSATPSPADLQAAALFDVEDGRLADAEDLVNRLPASAMTPDMLAIQARGALNRQIANALAQNSGNPALARKLLVTLAAAPDPDGERGAAIATALAQAGDGQGAQLAIQAAIAANPGASPAALLNYAGALLAAGQDEAASQVVQTLQSRGGLTPDQQTTLASLRNGLAIRASDRLAGKGRFAEAYDQLAPRLAQSPGDPALNAALARLYQDENKPKQALAIDQALLGQDPGDLEARDNAVNAAIASGDFKAAAGLVQDGEALQPNEPLVWMMAANLARARNDNRIALDDLQTAQRLRQHQLIAPSGGAPAVKLTAAAPLHIDPFGDGGARLTGLSNAGPSTLGQQAGASPATPTPDPLSQQIASQIDSLRQLQMSFVQGGISFANRSGSAGLDQLQTFGTPVIGSFSPGGMGRLAFTATPTFLLAGQIAGDSGTQARFGSDALDRFMTAKNQNAAGVGLNAAYTLPWLKANLGGTPIGFRTQNLVGGVELDPSLPGGVSLSVAVSRQPVTDSLLSYASTVDPRSGTVFGGVLRDRVNGQVSVATGPGYLYLGGGADQLEGRHVRRNREIEFGAGAGYPVLKNDSSTTTTGVNLVYFSYNRNEDFFTLGNGGYFSPQSYFAALMPVDYKWSEGALTWDIGGSLGVQSYHEKAEPYFPEDPGLQDDLAAAAALNDLQTFYPSQAEIGLAGEARGSFEYRLTSNVVIGGNFDYQRTGNWNQTQALVYARYLIGESE